MDVARFSSAQAAMALPELLLAELQWAESMALLWMAP
jgi:hypothetical protein